MTGEKDPTDTPDEVNWDDPESVAKHLGIEQPDDVEDPVEEPEKPEPAPEAKQDKPEPQPEPEQQEEEVEPEGVMLRDNKNIAPYSVLETARAEAAKQTQRAEAAEQKLADYEAEKERLKDTKTGDDLDDAIKQLEDEHYPDNLLKVVRAAHQAARDATARADRLEADRKAEIEARESRTRQDEQDQIAADHHQAIQATPFLARLERSGGPLWDQANAISTRLLDEAEKAGKQPGSRADHYKAVESELKSLLGVANAADKPLPDDDPSPPSSISNMPGGAAPKASEADAFKASDSYAQVALMADMNPDQMAELAEKALG